MATQRASVFIFLKQQLRARTLLSYVVIFLLCFCSAKFGQYLFFSQNTSPALIWAPFGLALGAVLIGGYRMWLPIALAALFAAATNGMPTLPALIASTAGQTFQPLLTAWVMNYFGFDGRLSYVKDGLILLAAAFFGTVIAPSFSLPVQIASHVLAPDLWNAWSRSWAGGILSVLILTPLMTTWWPFRPLPQTRARRIETLCAFAALEATVIFLFWTPYASGFGLSGLYVLLGILVWISLDMEPRLVVFALFLMTLLGMAGTIVAHPTAVPINQQLFSDEIVIEFIAAIFIFFMAIIEDRRRSQRELLTNVTQLERALKKIESEEVAKNQFIATLAHELRNPLAPVVSALDLLSMLEPSPEAAQTIEGAQRELSIMRRLLDDILDVARISQTRFKLQQEIVDARSLVQRCVESTKNFLRNRKHTLTVVLSEEPVMIEVDPVRFEQIVVNLLNNAGKYTPSGGRIELSCEKIGSAAVIRVRDNGIGIPQESLSEVFEPFRQIRPTPQIGTGLGIGLWLTKRLVEMHDGKIEAQSEGSERGSSFVLYFPLKEGAVPGTNTKGKISTPVIPAFKILIVDDNEAAANAMQKLLKLKGHEVRVAYDGTSALAIAPEFLPRAMLVDIGLPDMSGYDLVRELRRQGSRATLIALTGFGQDEDKRNAMNAGFNYHLTKPVGIADIEALLSQISL